MVAALSSIVFVDAALCSEIQDAAKVGDLAKVEALLKSNPQLVNYYEATNTPPLLIALRERHIEVAQFLLANNADVNYKVPWYSIYGGSTALHMSALSGYVEGVALLLKYHANINATNDAGQTPLHVATHLGRTEVAKLLLDNHADVSIKDDEGKTPLLIAVQWWRVEIIRWLIADHADVNTKDKAGQTPLHIAVQGQQTDIVKMLLAAGADTKAMNDEGQTPLQLAKSLDKSIDEKEIEALLQKNSGK
jgi:ankyrin repeat protein